MLPLKQRRCGSGAMAVPSAVLFDPTASAWGAHDAAVSVHMTPQSRRNGDAPSVMAIVPGALISSNNRGHSIHNRGSTRNSRPLPARKEP
jgi:hypothetical protein